MKEVAVSSARGGLSSATWSSPSGLTDRFLRLRGVLVAGGAQRSPSVGTATVAKVMPSP